MHLQQILRHDPPATDSIFLAVEKWFQEDGDRSNALTEIVPTRCFDHYRSVIDFLLCEADPTQKFACRKFYAGKGPQLRETCTANERQILEAKILILCEVAYQSFALKRQASWRLIRETARELAA